MKLKIIFIAVLALTAVVIIAVTAKLNHPPKPVAVWVLTDKPAPSIAPLTAPPMITAANPPLPVSQVKTNVAAKPAMQTNAASVYQPLKINGSEVQDPVARVALSFVGADPDADAYWTDAIFDKSLSDKERADLMEDLNEDGLSDPKHPGPEDLPLILNRLAIIEEVTPYADPFMQEHLGEAYKDLNNILAGKPVQ